MGGPASITKASTNSPSKKGFYQPNSALPKNMINKQSGSIK